ncbi:unnamed protein product [Trichogramma brassicae]|uniref:Uncharacterized protein n=1 Tax=Trichogramma brassicae TaxID=86971 RepID=A0A6H5ISI1_9HYME|nr:unnamed protein product [Trichogramma brassicae]
MSTSPALHISMWPASTALMTRSRKFLEIGQDIDCLVSKTGDSLLHLAAARGHQHVATMLLMRGADPNLANKEGWTSLHFICNRLYDDDFAELFFKICDEKHQMVQVNAQDKKGRTPLSLAVKYNVKKTVLLLLKRGANPNMSEYNLRWTPLHVICQKKVDDEILGKMLFEISDEKNQTVQVNAQNKWGNTPLFYALKGGHKKMVELLLRRGANPNLANNRGLIPLSVCLQNGNDELVKIFFKINDELNQQLVVLFDRALMWAISRQARPASKKLYNTTRPVRNFPSRAEYRAVTNTCRQQPISIIRECARNTRGEQQRLHRLARTNANLYTQRGIRRAVNVGALRRALPRPRWGWDKAPLALVHIHIHTSR